MFSRRFLRDWDKLTPQRQRAFREAVAEFIADLAKGERGGEEFTRLAARHLASYRHPFILRHP